MFGIYKLIEATPETPGYGIGMLGRLVAFAYNPDSLQEGDVTHTYGSFVGATLHENTIFFHYNSALDNGLQIAAHIGAASAEQAGRIFQDVESRLEWQKQMHAIHDHHPYL